MITKEIPVEELGSQLEAGARLIDVCDIEATNVAGGTSAWIAAGGTTHT
ncbi:MAG: hypothetical protein M3337_05750 [Actinomycetota bacterium]|nr:hypothetical protein [Actinomycetota bacterium]